ncbi:cytochrome P450 [Lasiosphaeria hispida]|uniref:Cytochrome P450 monooxygenase ABA1 n=1 Tax=Lasiosphaeria hispida TaxID=260671 RepID=A0AAJ0HF54_9PEZI|nr:cytochrome P450 [Lasiosphaeria hispida]
MAISILVTLLINPTILRFLITGFFIYVVSSSVLSWYRLRHFKGPLSASLSYFFIVKAGTSGRMWDVYKDLNKQYGPLARIGPNDLITDDPDIIRRMSAARSTYQRSGWYSAMKLNPYQDSMFSLRDTAAHDKLKHRCAAGYAGRENPTIEAGVDFGIAGFINLIRTKYLSTETELKPLDFGRKTQYLTLDTITKIAFSREFGFLATDSDVHRYVESTESMFVFNQLCGEVPWMYSIFHSDWMLGLLGPKATDEKGLGKLMGLGKELVVARFGPDRKDEQDTLGAFVRHGLTQSECETEALFQILAGSDTTATAIRATMLYIITTPRVSQALRTEIAKGIRDGTISNPITHDEAKKLPYLQAVIWEGLRIHAPFTGLVPKEVPPGGDTVHGKFIPGGTRIAHNTWAVLRRADIFGEDADLFRPERWLGTDTAQTDLMQRTTELVFGYGRWGCAGKSLAFLELNKVFVQLLRNFDLQIIYPAAPWQSTNYSLFVQEKMWVRVTEAGPTDG